MGYQWPASVNLLAANWLVGVWNSFRTTTEIAKLEGKDAAKRHSGHRTNKAFDRYCQMDEKESSDMAQLVIRRRTRADVLELKKKAK